MASAEVEIAIRSEDNVNTPLWNEGGMRHYARVLSAPNNSATESMARQTGRREVVIAANFKMKADDLQSACQ